MSIIFDPGEGRMERVSAIEDARDILREMGSFDRCPYCHLDPDDGHALDCRIDTWLRLHPAPAPDAPMTAPRALNLALLAMRFATINRATQLHSGESESDAAHTVMLILVACSIAATAPERFDVGRVAELASVHDLPEVITGDVSTLGMNERELAKKARHDAYALAELISDHAENGWLTSRLLEYENQRTPESRLVRYVDKLTPKLTHVLNSCATLRHLEPAAIRRIEGAQRERLARQYPELVGLLEPLFDELTTQAATVRQLSEWFESDAFAVPLNTAALDEFLAADGTADRP